MSIPRQVGKTWDVGALVFALCIIQPGLLVIWTAHRFKVARETFNALKALAKTPKLAPHVDPDDIYSAAGNESITFRNGSRIVFSARERGAVRGLSKVDVLIIDEGQILTEGALSDMTPTTNQAANPLIVLMGTPPRPIDSGEVFKRLRAEALSGESDDTLWVEFAAPEGSDPDDRKAWRTANPSYPKRTPAKAIQRMRKLLSLDDFLREGLGIWTDSQDAPRPIDLAVWAKLKGSAPSPETAVLVVDVSPDRRFSSIGVAAAHGDKTLLLVRHGGGTGWVVGELVELVDRHDILDVSVVRGQADALVPDIVAAGVEVERITGTELGAATAAFLTGIGEHRFVHVGQPELDAAVGNARTRRSGEAEVWDRRDWSGPDVSPLVACSAAAFRWAKQAENDYDPVLSVG